MKKHIAPIALSLLAGAITVSAQPQDRQQKPQRRTDAAYGQRQNNCPACGQPRRAAAQQKQRMQQPGERRGQRQNVQHPQRRGPQQQQFRGQQGRQQFQRKGPQQQFNGPRGQQFQHKGQRGNLQFQRKGPQQQQFNGRGTQSQQRPSPEQIKRMQMKRRAMLERYDRDGDGSLSERERAAIRRDFQKKRGEQPERTTDRRRPEGRQRGPQHQQ